ncbi:DNA-processing protein DprA [Caulobacter sp. 17J80-11]|uniref:DNA-processing protein DprA n=1 Tax=Caulobacter sp. 17J80-11 TaxID=2763502 RepID=UPI0016536E70|nr:DNA-processing protein DprA [Caulobacter sp. 17J80-11]MBC6982055.1 DNA-protecting protein DprA [Caulobacter sp. 17J80-11]
MDRGERFDRLRLARTERVGPVAFDQLVKRFGSAGAALEALPHLARRGGADGFSIPPEHTINAELEAGEALGARLLVLGDDGFPPQLAALDPPPPVLWTLGDPGLLSKNACAVVGARIASSAGLRFARGLAAELGQAGLTVTSGMARGIDGAAHEGALPTGTVAVLAGGIDDVYPPEHDNLWGRIREGGCIVSEQAPGVRAKAHDFPRRNRIISGLSRAVVVVEAELRSGSLITARLAAEQGREVLAVPGSPLEPRAKGTNDLIRQGAALCEGAEDVLRALAAPRTLREPDGRWDGAVPDDEVDAVRDRVLALLSPTAIPRDELARGVGAPAAVVFAALVELALAGEAELLPGGMVCRS